MDRRGSFTPTHCPLYFLETVSRHGRGCKGVRPDTTENGTCLIKIRRVHGEMLMGASVSHWLNANVLGSNIILNYLYLEALQSRESKSLFFFLFKEWIEVRRKQIQTIALPCNEFKYTIVFHHSQCLRFSYLNLFIKFENGINISWKTNFYSLSYNTVSMFIITCPVLVSLFVCVMCLRVCDHLSAPTLSLGFCYFKRIELG